LEDSWSKDFFLINYRHYESPPTTYEEKVIYVSGKYQGASMFIYKLAERLQSRRIPAVYCKFEYHLDNEYEIADTMGLPSLRILEDAVVNWNKKKLIPYILIDGLEL
jgi:hypothetical protein